jgi:hypothetical protein
MTGLRQTWTLVDRARRRAGDRAICVLTTHHVRKVLRIEALELRRHARINKNLQKRRPRIMPELREACDPTEPGYATFHHNMHACSRVLTIDHVREMLRLEAPEPRRKARINKQLLKRRPRIVPELCEACDPTEAGYATLHHSTCTHNPACSPLITFARSCGLKPLNLDARHASTNTFRNAGPGSCPSFARPATQRRRQHSDVASAKPCQRSAHGRTRTHR